MARGAKTGTKIGLDAQESAPPWQKKQSSQDGGWFGRPEAGTNDW